LRPGRRAVVLVASERQAHAIRRHLGAELERPGDLAGVLLLRPAEFARELLIRAGRVRRPGWERIRPLRVLALFESGSVAPALRYFDAEQLRSGQGYVDAFARTIDDLEASGLTAPGGLQLSAHIGADDRVAADRLHDVAVIWEAADAGRAAQATPAQLLAEAAALVNAQPALVTPFGGIAALLAASPPAVLVRFLRALPECQVVFHNARPLRTGTQRWRALLGLAAGPGGGGERDRPPTGAPAASRRPADPGAGGAAGTLACAFSRHTPGMSAGSAPPSELELVQRFLFERPEVLTDPQRPRSPGADGSVDFEEHASVNEEIDAAAAWVAEQIAAGTRLEEIAVVVPEVDPYAAPLIDRLQRLAGCDDGVPCAHVAGGLSLAATPAGRRLQMVLHALARGLEAEATIRVLPSLRRADQAKDDPHARLSPSRAATIVYGAGIVGGSPGDPHGVGEWLPRLRRRRDAERRLLTEGDAPALGPETRRARLERQNAQRWLRDVEPILPGVEALQHLAEAILGGLALGALWHQLRDFAERWLRMPPQPPNLLAILEQRLHPVLSSPAAATVGGVTALLRIADTLQRERWQGARFGEPCVFIGTPAQTAALTFSAVRILGLAEGALPQSPHDDPIVPDALRGQIETAARALDADSDIVVPRLADRVLDDLHDVWRVVGGVRRRLALSVPRQWIDRSEREVSGILLEAATALGRPAPNAGDEGDVPTAARLRAAYLDTSRRTRAGAPAASAVLPGARGATQSATLQAFTVPASWTGNSALAADRLWEVSRIDGDALRVADASVADSWGAVVPPGLTPQRPLSATGLLTLLSCPHRFLLERVLHLEQPPTRPATDVISAVAYGSLFHAAAERFFADAGPPLCRREGTLEQWLACARRIADAELDARRHEYPLRGADGLERERTRLRQQIEHLVRYEWQTPPREFVASELSFGEPEALCLEVDGGALYLRGAIDRVDRIGRHTLSVRDLKTGRVRDLNEETVNAARDLQIGLYVLALEARGGAAAAERVVHAAYVHPSATQEPDRAFEGPRLEQLRQQARRWLSIARQLLGTGSFPRTPNREDCTFCPFLAACGDDAHARSARKLAALPPGHVLAAFAQFKRQGMPEDA
jgi:RecB family exonuclease